MKLSKELGGMAGVLSIAVILWATVLLWCLLSATAISTGAMLATAIFCAGIACWSLICRSIWPSQTSLNSYLPLGFSILSLIALLMIMLKLGTLLSCILASSLGIAGSISIITIEAAKQPENRKAGFHRAATKESLTALVLVGLIASLMMLNQLDSINKFSRINTTMVIQSWTDVILHANTVLTLSSLPTGQGPISSFDYSTPIIPYHYVPYVFAALFSSISVTVSPLASFTTLVAPLGCLMLMLPLSEQLIIPGSKPKYIIGLAKVCGLGLIYSAWTRLISNTLLDPAWLLITAPATLYACAIVLSCLHISTRLEQVNFRKRSSLILASFTLVALSKVQIAHALTPMLAILIASSCAHFAEKWTRKRIGPFVYGSLGIIVLAFAALQLNAALGVERSNPLQDLLAFLLKITTMTWVVHSHSLNSVLTSPWIGPLLGLATLYGPVFLLALVYSTSNANKPSTIRQALVLISVSYCISLVISPSMPWDDGEFLNRSWPMLWCIGVWVLFGIQIKLSDRNSSIRLLAISSFAIAMTLVILPESKKVSIASPPSRSDWSKDYYPTRIDLEDKELATVLREKPIKGFFFANSTPSNTRQILDDLPSRLAALSGMRPLISRLSFQESLEDLSPSTEGSQTIRMKYERLSARFASACDSRKHHPGKPYIVNSGEPIQGADVVVVCSTP